MLKTDVFVWLSVNWEIHYRNYEKFDLFNFNVDLKNAFPHEKIVSCINLGEVL